MRTIFDYRKRNGTGGILPELDVPAKKTTDLIPQDLIRQDKPRIPNLSEPEVVRHYTALSKLNYGVDDGLYPLGSCTMKYNPKVNEDVAHLPGFASIHPAVDPELAQGSLSVVHKMSRLLCGITGMADVTLQPAAGAHGEITGMFLLKRYFEARGETQRTRILLPDSAHGTNPASAATAGFSVTEIRSGADGLVDLNALSGELDETVAGVMLTVPNTLGIFEENIMKITAMVHATGGLCYFDGANLNAFLGHARPGDMGADVFHFNLHKTMSAPHGGGGPGSGPVAVSEALVPFLPVPRVRLDRGRYYLDWEKGQSIGSMHSFYGNFGVFLKAYTYILTLGDEGLYEAGENAVLNANYLQERLKKTYRLPYDRLCKHEFVLTGKGIADGISTLDIAKRLIDYGFHPPTIYFPLIVHEALMIEPTETESRETLDRFAEALEKIASEAQENPDLLHNAPHTAPVRRLDQTRAARNPILTYPFGD
ncbi:aminomethyl-transferring glycine dehydrogenase subunit GcvPB [Candidatus Bipolaricaulota bacterium]|nr:aminomethyl-transferring glycine dehydrogenase subunit GcvPB [Candidatus Bipolaricaulota bacterium]HHR85660.1 glycine dehydrogenase subunit 2 [Candidatus Acetothermia bacterium]